MMNNMDNCYHCNSTHIKKNGHAPNQKQQYYCNSCNKGFIERPEDTNINLIRKMLLEKISLRGIARVLDISLSFILRILTEIYAEIPEDLGCKLASDEEMEADMFLMDTKEGTEIEAEADEMWSFVKSKDNKQWIWLIIDRATRQIIAYHVGGRTKNDARKLLNKIPENLMKNMKIFTDYLKSYEDVIPSNQHVASGKDSGNTNHIERFNCTMRQRVSRLVRSSLSFSKNLSNHIGAIGYFITHYNREILAPQK